MSAPRWFDWGIPLAGALVMVLTIVAVIVVATR